MKAEIVNEILIITPGSKTEEYALAKWFEQNSHKCTLEIDGRNIGYNDYESFLTKIKRQRKLRYIKKLNKR